MGVWKYEIVSRVEQDILLVRFAHSWDILINTRDKFHQISAHPCIILYIIIYLKDFWFRRNGVSATDNNLWFLTYRLSWNRTSFYCSIFVGQYIGLSFHIINRTISIDMRMIKNMKIISRVEHGISAHPMYYSLYNYTVYTIFAYGFCNTSEWM